MLNFLLAVAMVLIVLGIIVAFVAWAIREHLVARKYRYLIRLHNQLPKSELQTPAHINKVSGWEVTYKMNRKQFTITVPGPTESEAMRQVLNQGIDFQSIVKFSKL